MYRSLDPYSEQRSHSIGLNQSLFCIHTVGVSLKLHGVTIPNNSLVDFDDLLYSGVDDNNLSPTNANGLQTLICVTDLEDCCETQMLGNWYYPDPDGHRRVMEHTNGRVANFRSNRGQNQVMDNQKFYGSIRLWRRYTPAERGRFRCELPTTKNNQTLFANIGELLY